MWAIWVLPGVGARAADDMIGHDGDLTELDNPLVESSHAVRCLAEDVLAASVELGGEQCVMDFFLGKLAGERAALVGEILHEVLHHLGHRLLILMTADHTRLHAKSDVGVVARLNPLSVGLSSVSLAELQTLEAFFNIVALLLALFCYKAFRSDQIVLNDELAILICNQLVTRRQHN